MKVFITFVTAFSLLSAVFGLDFGKKSFDIYCLGNCQKDYVTNSTLPGVVLMGGGTDTNEVISYIKFVIIYHGND